MASGDSCFAEKGYSNEPPASDRTAIPARIDAVQAAAFAGSTMRGADGTSIPCRGNKAISSHICLTRLDDRGVEGCARWR
ncbi:MAG: hypothetical protein WA860_02080 [Acidimicrobiales bacterium]